WACLGLWHQAAGPALKALLRTAQLGAGLLLPALLLRGPERHFVAKAWLAGLLMTSLWALAQSALGPSHPLDAGREGEVFPGGFMAAAAGMGHHNQLGAALVAGLLFSLAALRVAALRAWAWPALLAGALAFLCTLSRGAWASFLLAALLLTPLLKGCIRWLPL